MEQQKQINIFKWFWAWQDEQEEAWLRQMAQRWQYFRKPASLGEVEEIYTDPESKVQKYQRVLAMLVVFLPIMIFLLSTGTGAPSSLQPIYAIARVIGAGLMILYAVAILQLLRRIRRLKRRP